MSEITIKHNVTLHFGTNKENRADLLGGGPITRQNRLIDSAKLIKNIVALDTPWPQVYDTNLNLENQHYNYHLTVQPDPKLKCDVYDYCKMQKSFIKFIQANHTLTNSLSATTELGKGLKPHLHIIFSATNNNAQKLKAAAKNLYTAGSKNNVASFLQPITDNPTETPCYVTWCGESTDKLPDYKKYGETGYPYLQKEPQNRQKLLLHKKYSRNVKKRQTKKEKEEGQKLLNKEYPIE
jgi:hypothetical protein